MFPPERIVCLTEETVETLYLLGEQHRIAGITGYAVRPKQARAEKPRIAAFTTADIERIVSLSPDLVLSFSDLQADLVAVLIRRGIAVHAFNQRSATEIFAMIRMLGAMVGASEKAGALAATYEARVAAMKADAPARRPRVFFEEWNEPLICGIQWISELIEIAGGVDIFPDRARSSGAKGRIVTHEEVVALAPDIIIGSWCGTKFNPDMVAARPGFANVPAVKTNQLHEIKSPLILAPGPAALTDGLDALRAIIVNWPGRT